MSKGNTYPYATQMIFYSSIDNGNTYPHYITSNIVPPNYNPKPIDTNFPIYALPFVYIYQSQPYFIILHVYRSTDSKYYFLVGSRSGVPYTLIPAVMSDENGRIISQGQPAYNFNQIDTVYIDLQIGELISSIQALTDLITAINANLITATIAIQSNSPSDLPVDTGPYIDFVNYCNEQTNLALSGYHSIAEAVGNMYTEMYDYMETTTSTSLLNAIIGAYNAFINKLTLFQVINGSSGSGSLLQTVQDYQEDLSDIRDSYTYGTITSAQAITQASALLYSYVSDAASVEEIIGLNSAYQSFAQDLGLVLDISTNVTSSIVGFNSIVDSFLIGNIDTTTALNSLLTAYKSALQSSKTIDGVTAIISAYQACVDRISLNAFSIDPDTIGTTVPEVIDMEDDLLKQLNINSLSSFLQFQNWQYINTNEGNLYREYFQRIMDSQSPFYVFIYVPLVLGIVGIILGTRIHFGGKNVSREKHIDHEKSR